MSVDSLNISLSEGLWQALRARLCGESCSPIDRAELESRGLLSGNGLSDEGKELLQGMLSPAGSLRLHLSTEGRICHGVVFVDLSRISLFIQTDGPDIVLRRLEQGMLPLMLVKLLGIAHRDSTGRNSAHDLPAHMVLDLLSDERSGEESREANPTARALLARDVRAAMPDVHASLLAGEWRLWTLEALAMENPPRSRGAITVLDTPRCVLDVSFDEDRAWLKETTSSDIWLKLSKLIAPAA